MKYTLIPYILLPLLLSIFADRALAQSSKQLYVPEKVYRVPEANDYDDKESEYSFHRMIETENIAIFWPKEYGDDPMTNSDPKKRFDVHAALAECERFYQYFADTLKFVERGQSWTDQYKILFYVLGGDEGTAFGGGADDKIGILWSPPVRMSNPPYATLAHELGHAFQYLLRMDGGQGLGGPVVEMTSQYMLWQVYPEWMSIENYHLVSFMEKTHFAFLHPTNMYHSPYVLEYWSGKHGKDMIAKLWRCAEQGEDAVMAYKRLTNINQETFNDEMFDAYRRFITWDLERVREVASPYANQHHTKLVDSGDGWSRIDSAKVPENYGYNGIKLSVPDSETEIYLDFEGLESNAELTRNTDGWRYGFVAYQADGTRVYGDVHRGRMGRVSFAIPAETEHLWLVVMGAPPEHQSVPMRRRGEGEQPPQKTSQWPYRIKLSGTIIDGENSY